MLKKIGILGVLSAVMLGAVPYATRADNATVQTSTQEAIVNGNNNQVIQINNQLNLESLGIGRGRRRGSQSNSTAVVQDSYQGAVVEGNGNQVYQESTQENRVEQESRGRGRRWDNGDDDDDDDDNRSHRNRRRGDDDDDDD